MKLTPFKLERYFAQYEFTAPYLLSSSDCESMALNDVLALEPGAAQRFGELWLGYTEAPGDPQLRAEISTLYEHAGADDVLVHAGAEEAIYNFMNAVVAPADHVVVHGPCYQSLAEVARGIGAEVSNWVGDAGAGWALDLNRLEDVLTPRTKIVVVNLPHNPTGFLPDLSFVYDLAGLAERYGFVIFCDEVYRGLEFAPQHRLPAMTDVNEQAVSLGVMSKTYGLAGLRIGWITTRNAEIYSDLVAQKDYTTICNSAPSEFLAAVALRHRDEIVDRNLGIIADNLDHLDRFFDAHTGRFRWQRPKAGSIAFPELLVGDIDEFCTDLVEQAGVMLVPGSLFGEGYNAFRIGFGRKNFAEGLERFDAYLMSHAVS